MDCDYAEHINKWWWGYTFTIILDGGKGIIEVQLDDNCPSTAFIKGLSVIEEERHKGIGKELMEFGELTALREKMRFLQLTVNKDQDWLVKWYQKLGFVIILSDEHEFTMLKVLSENIQAMEE